MSFNNKPICVYYRSGPFWSFVVKSCWKGYHWAKRAQILSHWDLSTWIMWITPLKYNWEKIHRVSCYENVAFYSIRRCLSSSMYFSFRFFFNFFRKYPLCTVPRLYRTQTMWQQTPHFWVTRLLQLTKNINELGARCFPRALGLHSALLSSVDPFCWDQQVHQSMHI